ncbi:MAG: hypothetical protein MJ078_03700, partial [Clostridia bacterium]|nr:hypothetical protein [Clostridia bacterium]
MSEKATIWKIVYQSYEGMQKKAVALLSREIGRYVTRDPGVYTLHVLPCEKEGAMADKNAVFIGEYAKSPVLRQYIAEDEVKKDGYVVKVMENPQNPAYRYVLIAGDTDSAVFYGAVDFIDVYCPMWGEPLPDDPTENALDLVTSPLTFRTRS